MHFGWLGILICLQLSEEGTRKPLHSSNKSHMGSLLFLRMAGLFLRVTFCSCQVAYKEIHVNNNEKETYKTAQLVFLISL